MGGGDVRGGARGYGIVLWLCPPRGALRTSWGVESGRKEEARRGKRGEINMNRHTHTFNRIPGPFYSGQRVRKFCSFSPYTQVTPLPRSQFWSGRVNLSFWVCHPAKSLNRHRPGNIKSRTLIIFLLLHTHKHPNTPNVHCPRTAYRQPGTTAIHSPPRKSQRRLPLIRLQSRRRPGFAYHALRINDHSLRPALCGEEVTAVYQVCPDRRLFGRGRWRGVGHDREWFGFLCGA